MNRTKESLLSQYDMQAATRLIIFVEDEDKEKEYEVAFKQYLENNKCIPKYVSAGDKPSVISIYKNETFQNKNHMIFLLDKDFDEFLDKLIDDSNIVYTKYYDIEAVYISNASVIDTLLLNYPDIEKYFSYDSWMDQLLENMKQLLVSFVLARKFSLHNVPNSYDRIKSDIINPKSNYLNLEWISIQIEIVKNMFDITNYNVLTEKIEEYIIKEYDGDYEKLICGKILFMLLYKYIENNYTFKTDDKKRQLKTVLATGIRSITHNNKKFGELVSQIKNTDAYRLFI